MGRRGRYYDPGRHPQPHRPEKRKGQGMLEATESAIERSSRLQLEARMRGNKEPAGLTRQQRRKLEREGRAPWLGEQDPMRQKYGPAGPTTT